MTPQSGPAEVLRLCLSPLGPDEEQELAGKTARTLAKNGHTAAWLREQASREGDQSFWVKVAAELDALEAAEKAAAEARSGFRALPGEARLPATARRYRR